MLAMNELEQKSYRKADARIDEIREQADELERIVGGGMQFITALCHDAARLHAFYEEECNRELTEEEKESATNLEHKIHSKIHKIKRTYDLCVIKRIEFSGDPRGYPVKLHLDPPRGNTMGGTSAGWGIG